MLEKKVKKLRRHRRVRAKINGTAEVPRLCVFRSNKHIYAQIIDDDKGKTLVSAKDVLTKASKVGEDRIYFSLEISIRSKPLYKHLICLFTVSKSDMMRRRIVCMSNPTSCKKGLEYGVGFIRDDSEIDGIKWY